MADKNQQILDILVKVQSEATTKSSTDALKALAGSLQEVVNSASLFGKINLPKIDDAVGQAGKAKYIADLKNAAGELALVTIGAKDLAKTIDILQNKELGGLVKSVGALHNAFEKGTPAVKGDLLNLTQLVLDEAKLRDVLKQIENTGTVGVKELITALKKQFATGEAQAIAKPFFDALRADLNKSTQSIVNLSELQDAIGGSLQKVIAAGLAKSGTIPTEAFSVLRASLAKELDSVFKADITTQDSLVEAINAQLKRVQGLSGNIPAFLKPVKEQLQKSIADALSVDPSRTDDVLKSQITRLLTNAFSGTGASSASGLSSFIDSVIKGAKASVAAGLVDVGKELSKLPEVIKSQLSTATKSGSVEGALIPQKFVDQTKVNVDVILNAVRQLGNANAATFVTKFADDLNKLATAGNSTQAINNALVGLSATLSGFGEVQKGSTDKNDILANSFKALQAAAQSSTELTLTSHLGSVANMAEVADRQVAALRNQLQQTVSGNIFKPITEGGTDFHNALTNILNVSRSTKGEIDGHISSLERYKNTLLGMQHANEANGLATTTSNQALSSAIGVIDSAISKYKDLNTETARVAASSTELAAKQFFSDKNGAEALLKQFKDLAQGSDSSAEKIFSSFTKIANVSALLNTKAAEGSPALKAFRDQFVGISASGDNVTSVLNRAVEAFNNLFRMQGGLGRRFDLGNMPEAINSLKNMGADLDRSGIFKSTSEQLAVLDSFLTKAGYSSTQLGQNVRQLFSVTTDINNFKERLAQVSVEINKQGTDVARLSTIYESITNKAAEFDALAKNLQNLSGDARANSLARQATLQSEINQLMGKYASEQRKVGLNQDLINTALATLRTKAAELGNTPAFEKQNADAIRFTTTLAAVVKGFDALDLTSKGFGTQLTGGLKTAESELTAISKSLSSSFVHLRVSINTQLSAIGSGADGNVADRIKHALNKVLEAIRSGTGVEAAFDTLRTAFTVGFASLAGNVEKQNKLESVFKTITKSLGDEATRLGTKLGQVGIDFPQSFAAGGRQAELATKQVNGLNAAVTESNKALREVGQAAKTDALNTGFTTLASSIINVANQLNSLSKVDGILKGKDLETAKALQRELTELTSRWKKFQQSSDKGLIDPQQFNNLDTRLTNLRTRLQGLFDRSVLDNFKTAIGGIQQQFQKIIPTDVFDSTSLIQKLRQTGIDASAVFKQALVGDLQKIPTAQLDKISKEIGNAIRNSTAAGDTQTRTTLIALAKDWENYKNLVVQANNVIALAANKGLGALREGTAQSGELNLGRSFVVLQGQVQAANTEAIALRQTLTNLLSGQGGDSKQLVADFVALSAKTKELGGDVGRARSELQQLNSLISVIGNLKLDPQIRETLLAPLRVARDELQQLSRAKEQLDQAGTKSFGKDLEHLVTLADRGNNQLNLLNTVSKEFATAGYFSKPAEDLNKAYLQLQRMESALTNIKSGLQSQLQIGRLGSTDPELAASITKQIAALDQAIVKTQRYGQVLEQLRSGAKAEIFNRLTQGLQSVVQAADAANQKLKSKGIAEGLTANLSAVGSTFATLSAQILNSGNALSKDLVDNFKNVSAQTKVTAKDLEAWLRVLESQKTAGVRKVTLDDGSRVAVGRLIREVTTLLTTFGNIGPAVAQADAALKSRLGSTLGQLQLKVEESINKFNLLQTSIKGLSQAGAETNTFTSLRKMLDELAKPFDVNNKFFTMGKEVYTPLRNELQQYTESLKAALNVLNLYVSTVRSSGDASIIQSQGFKDTERQLQQLQKAYNEASAATIKFNQYGKEANEFTPLNAQLGGAAGSMKALLERGALLSHGMQKFFSFIAKSSGQLNVIPANAKLAIEAFKALEQQMVRFRSGIIQWTMGVQMAGQAMLDPFKKATAGFIDFSDRMGIIASVSNALTSEFYELKNAAILMGATTRFTTEQAAEGLEKLARAGFNVQQQLEMLPSVMRLAQAAATDLATAAEISTIVMNEFRMDPSQFAEATDVLALAANRTQATVSDLGFGFKYIGALAANVGADFSDLTASLALLHNAGMKGCYDDQTEILTKSGFKLFKDLHPDDAVMTINKDSLEMEWQVPNGHYQFTINEPMFRLKSKYVDLLVTDNHRLLIETRAGRQSIVEAKDFKEGFFHRTGIWKGNDSTEYVIPGLRQDRGSWTKGIDPLTVDMKSWVDFLGWYFAEGSLTCENGNYKIRLTQSKGPGISDIQAMLEKLPFKFKYSHNNFTIYSQQLYDELESYGKGFAGKRIPVYVKELSPEYLRIFLESFRKGDGDESYKLYTSNKGMSEDLYEIGIKCGYGVRSKVVGLAGDQKIIEGRTVTATQDAHIISISTQHTKPFVSLSEMDRRKEIWGDKCNLVHEWIPYEGQVYSVNVDNSLVFVRRNGFGVFCGNTMAGTALRGMMQRLMNPTKESAALIRDLSDRIGGAGLVLQDARGNFVGFSSILQQLEKAGITTAETLKIFGQRAGPGMAALLAMGSDKLKELEEDLENSAGTAARMADTMEKTFKGQLLLMRSAFSALSDSVGMNLSQTLMPLAATMADLTNKFIALRNAFPSLTAAMDTGLASIALFAATLGAVAVAWSMIIIPTIQFIGMLKTVSATFFIAAGAMAASTTATAVNTVATGINTGSKIANAAATGAVAGAQSAVVVSTNAATGAIVAQTVALNANAAASARMILGALFSAKGLAAMGKFLVTNPWGIAITALGTIGILTLNQKKSVEIVNVELQKQREILEANRREMEILGNKAAATADRIQSLQARLDAAQGNERLSANIELDLKANEAQYQAQLREIFNRLTDQNSAFKTEFVPIVDLDPVTGEFKSFSLEIAKTGDAFDLMTASAEANATALRKVVGLMNDAGRARDLAVLSDKLKNTALSTTGRYSFWQQYNPFNKDDFASVEKDIRFAQLKVQRFQSIINELQKPLEDRRFDRVQEKILMGFGNIRDIRISGILPDSFLNAFSEAGNELAALQIKNEKLISDFVAALKANFEGLAPELQNAFADMPEVEQSTILLNLIEESIKAEPADVRKLIRSFADPVIKSAREELIKSREQLQKELTQIKPVDVNQAGALLSSISRDLASAEEQLKDSLDAQKDLIEKGKTLIGEIEKFQSIMTEAFAADLTLKLGKVTFEEGTDVDRLKAEFDAFASKLEIESKVVELPLSAKIKDLGKVGASTFSALDRLNTGILSYERQFNQKLFSAREDFESKNKSRLLQSLKEQEDAIEAHLAKVEGLYKDGDNINNLREQQNQLSALRRIKEEEYQIAKSSYDRQAQVLRDLAQKEKSITDDRLSIIDRIAKAQKTLQERGEDKKLSDTEAELEARAAKAEELGNAWLAARLRRQAVVEKERLESQREYQLRSQLLALEQQLTKELRTQKAAGPEGDFDRAKALRDELVSFAESAVGSIEPGGYLDSILQRVLINLGKSTETIDAGLKTQAQAQRTALESGMAAEQTAMQQSIQDLKQIDKELEDLVTKIQNIRIGEEIAVNVSTTEAYAKLRNFADEFKKTIRELDKQKILIDVAIAQQTDFDELREGATTAQATQARIVKLTDAYKELQKQQDRVASNQNPITNFKALDDAMRKVISTIANLSGGKINAPLAKNLQQETSAMTTLITGLKSDIESSNLTPDLQKLMLGVVEAYEKGINDINTVISRGDNTTDLARNLREGLENATDAVDQGEKELQDVLRNYDVLLIKLAALGIEVNKFLSGEGIGTGDDSREIATNNLRDFSQLAERMIELYRKMAQESDLSLERKAELSQLEAIARQFTLNQELTEDQVEFLNKIIELRRQEAEAIQRSNEIVKNSASFDPSAYSAKTGLALANVGELPPGAAEQARAAGRELGQALNEGVNQVTATGDTLGGLNEGIDRSLGEASNAIKSANLGSDLAASFEGQELNVPVPKLDLASLTTNAGELAALGNNIVAPLAAPIAIGIGTAIAESLAADAIIRGVEGLGTWIQNALSPPPLKVEYDTSQLEGENDKLLDVLKGKPVEPVEIKAEPAPGSSEAVGAAIAAGAANGLRGASPILERTLADIINRLAQSATSAANTLGAALAAAIAAALAAANAGAVVNVPAKVKVDASELQNLQNTALDVPATVKVDDSELDKLKSTAFDVPVAPVIKPKTPEEVRHAFIGGQELKVPVDMVTTEVVDMAGVEAQGAEYSRRFRENAEAQGIRMRVDSAVITHDINGVDQQLKSFTATDREIPLDIKSELIKRELTEIDQLLQQAQARRGPPQSAADIAMYAEADKQAINAKMRAVERIKALSDEAARAEYASHQQTTASANQAATAQIAANERVASNTKATQQQITTATNQAATAQIAAAQQVEANAPVVEIDFKAELLRQGLLEIDQMLQQAQARRKQYESVSQHAMNTEADKQAINAQMRLREQVAAMDQETARKKLEANQQAAAQLTESIANMQQLKELSDINPIRVDPSAQNLVGEIQADLERLKQSGATNIKVSLDSESGQLVVTADVSQANEQVGAILEKINSSSNVLKLDITAATAQTQALKAMIDRATANRTIRITYVETNKPSGGAQGRQHGGIIHRMAGGLIPVQKFAAGGIAKFKKLLSPIVPGSGSGDRVPAMLEPGEFVIRKKAVQGLGTDFLNLLNSGLIQFKNLGGMVESLPLNTLHNLSNMVGSTPNVPQLATDGGGTVNINLKVGDKNFNMKKIPRDQVSQLTNALSYLGRGL